MPLLLPGDPGSSEGRPRVWSSDPRESHSVRPGLHPPTRTPQFPAIYSTPPIPAPATRGRQSPGSEGSCPAERRASRGNQGAGASAAQCLGGCTAAPGSSAPAPPAAGDSTSSVQRSQPVRRQVGWEAGCPGPPCLCSRAGGALVSEGVFSPTSRAQAALEAPGITSRLCLAAGRPITGVSGG